MQVTLAINSWRFSFTIASNWFRICGTELNINITDEISTI